MITTEIALDLGRLSGSAFLGKRDPVLIIYVSFARKLAPRAEASASGAGTALVRPNRNRRGCFPL